MNIEDVVQKYSEVSELKKDCFDLFEEFFKLQNLVLDLEVKKIKEGTGKIESELIEYLSSSGFEKTKTSSGFKFKNNEFVIDLSYSEDEASESIFDLKIYFESKFKLFIAVVVGGFNNDGEVSNVKNKIIFENYQASKFLAVTELTYRKYIDDILKHDKVSNHIETLENLRSKLIENILDFKSKQNNFNNWEFRYRYYDNVTPDWHKTIKELFEQEILPSL